MLLVEFLVHPGEQQQLGDEQRILLRQRRPQRHAQRERIDVPDSSSSRRPSQAFKTVQPGMTVNYGSGGSGKGRTDLASGVVNYAGSDSPIPAAETANFKGKTVLYFPVLIGPITLSYNLSGLSKPLQLSAPVIAGIFDGKITTWNNSQIAADNPGVTLPSTPITIAVRSDSSGTTQNFSLFLKDATPSTWTLGSSSTIKWPATAHAGSGNSGVAQIVKSTPGADRVRGLRHR